MKADYFGHLKLAEEQTHAENLCSIWGSNIQFVLVACCCCWKVEKKEKSCESGDCEVVEKFNCDI